MSSADGPVRGLLAAVDRTLRAAGDNRGALEFALQQAPDDQRAYAAFLLAHMPPADARSLDEAFLSETCAYAARVRHEVPCGMDVPEDVFLEYVLPYAFVDERRERWRPRFFEEFVELARRSASIEDAVRTLNRVVFERLDVTFHATKRSHDNQSPAESMEMGFASCTGLSILLACACRAVGIPARLVGTPQWSDGSGNHTWVEVWDFGTWRFLGASEPGPYDLTWFNDRARAADSSRPEHRIFAARWSASSTRFPLHWSPGHPGVPADDVTPRYLAAAPTPDHPTRIVTEPRRVLCHRLEGPIRVTGRMDDPAWDDVAWTDLFVDIEGHRKPPPRFHTRAKLCWDDDYLYVGAFLDDPHVWATLTERNAILFNDPDFEVFIDPDGDNHAYYELEINALGTIWELTLERPYRDGGPVHRGDNMDGLVTAVHVHGTLNDPSDVDRGWSVEIAIPWSGLERYAVGCACPPEEGDRWRMNFSRVHWLVDVIGGGYRKVPRDAHPEDNWVWAPQDAIDMHRPETWGLVEFTADPPGRTERRPRRDLLWPARERLMDLYYQQRAREEPSAWLEDFTFRGVPDPSLSDLRIEITPGGWRAQIQVTTPDGRLWAAVNHLGRLASGEGSAPS